MFIKKLMKIASLVLVKATLTIQKISCENILVLGDSHTTVFSKWMLRAGFPFYYFEVVDVPGASVSGLTNPNSVTQARPIFLERISKTKARRVIILLGEVDTGFVIWYRSEKYNVNVDSMLNQAIINYQEFLTRIHKTHTVICVSAPLPTITDGQEWGEVANARKEIKSSQIERTNLTIRFNTTMRDFCLINGIEYIYLDNESIGEDGLVRPDLLNDDPADHHYNPKGYIALITKALRPYLKF